MDSKNDSIFFDVTKYFDNTSVNSLTLTDLQSLLLKRNVPKELYTHPTVVSLLKNILVRFPKLSLYKMDTLLDDIMSVSSTNKTISIAFNEGDSGKIFSYKLDCDYLIYTKQSFIKNSCTITTRLFDINGLKLCEYTDFYKLSEPPSYNTSYYEQTPNINKEGYSIEE